MLVAVVLAVQLLTLASPTTELIPDDVVTRPVDLGAYVIVIASTLPLLARRRAPGLALAASIVGLLVYAELAYEASYTGYPLLIALYSVVVYRGLRLGLLAGVTTFVALQLTYLFAELDRPAVSSLLDLLVVATGVALGDATRNRMAAEEANQARLEQMRTEQRLRAEEAVLEERTRIARELHDLVAHAMSVIAVQAGVGAHLIDQDPTKAKSALSTIEQTSRQALVEMRRMLGVLRTSDDRPADLEPQPGLHRLDAVVEQLAQSDLDVEVVVTGDPRALEPSVDLTAFRIIQEALTNAVKYAGPAHVTVTIDHGETELSLTITDDGRGASVPATGRHGLGLVGMRERAAAVGGSVDAGPRPGGGFQVAAVLPHSSAPPVPPEGTTT